MKFLIDFKNTATDNEIQDYLQQNSCAVLKEWDNFDKIFLVETDLQPPIVAITERVVEEVGLKIKPLDFIVDKFQYTHLDDSLPEININTSEGKDWWKLYSFVKPDFENPSMTIRRKGAGINVYMMDSGLEASHPEFVGCNIVNLYSVTPNDFSDKNGHGTALSSAVIGKTCGITDATLKVVKIFDPTHDTMQSEFLDALDAIANDHNPNTYGIVNCSWIIEKNEWIEHKLSLLIDQGVFVICAAGNQGTAIYDVTPASMLEAVTVGAYNQNLEPCNFSNYTGTSMISTTGGATNHGALDGWAPGEQIWAAGLNGTYGFVAGTSIASAIASAVCASNLYDTLKEDLTRDHGYSEFEVLPDINSGMFLIFNRINLLDLSDEKYKDSKNKIATLRDNSFLSTRQIPDEVSTFVKVGEKKVMAKIFVHMLTEKIEWIDNLPENFYLANEGNIIGHPTEVNAPAVGEQYRTYTVRYKRYNLDETVENCTCNIYVGDADLDTSTLPQDHPITISLQGTCSGFPGVCSLSPFPDSCASNCFIGGVCCDGTKFLCDCTEFGGGGTCFAGETLITMADGSTKQIKDIVDGDQILAYNFRTGQNEPNTVEHIHIRSLRNLYEYTLDDGTVIVTTDDHPLYIVNKGWASMNPDLSVRGYKSLIGRINKIEIGDDVFCLNKQAKIVSIEVKHYPNKVYTFNNKNKSSPTYYANGVLAY